MGVKSATAFGLASGLEPGLVLLNITSFSAVSSVSAPASTFTATYQAYRILFTMSASSASMDVSFKYRAAGSDLTNGYYGAFIGRDNANNSVTWAINNAAAAKISEQSTNTKRYFLLDMTLEAPQLTGTKPATFNLCGTTSAGGNILAGSGAFVQDITGTAADSCSFIASSGNFTGQMVIYGFNK